MSLAYQFKPHERPVVPGSPFTPDHPAERMWAYAGIGTLAGLTGGLGNALVTSNLAYFQGTLGLSAREAACIPAAFVMTNICANLVVVKFRQQFGLALFVRLSLSIYAFATLTHLFVHGFWTALVVRGVSGISAAGLTTLSVLAWLQAAPPAKRIAAMMVGISVPQLANPLARVLAPQLLEWGDWRMAYVFELGLALFTLAAVLALPLPPSERTKPFERKDFVTIALLFPAAGLLCIVLGLGRTDWWLSAPWIAWALIGSIILFAAAIFVEHGRTNPLVATRFLMRPAIVRLGVIAFLVRVITSEQSFASVGLLSTLGMGVEQFRTLYVVVTFGSLAGLITAVLAFRPQTPALGIQIACLLIAFSAFVDANSNSLTRPENVYLTQAIVGFATLLFVGPAFAIGLTRSLLAGPQNFITWLVVYAASQNLGSLVGSALFGTLQTVREKFHSSVLTEQVVLANPIEAAAIGGNAQELAPVIADPALRNAEGAALLAQRVAREANVLAYNDVFLIIGVLAILLFLGGIGIEMRMRRRGEISPIVEFGRAMVARLSAAKVEGPPS